MTNRWLLLLIWLLATGAALAGEPPAKPATAAPATLPPPAQRTIDFARDIQPIFAEHCLHCHGPDEQQGYLRLDAKAIVMHGGQTGPLLVAGKSGESLLVHRLVGVGTEKRMPLEAEPLKGEQIGLIRAWIDQGAKWPDGVGSPATEVNKHWAYVAPRTPRLPAVRLGDWPRSPLDTFVLARLEKEVLVPSPPAERAVLIRRASLDLVGLPPGVDEVDAFLADDHPDAWERLIDRLIASPGYGERWATPWLDAARYADSNGYQRDGHRTIWPFRDWVIRALNADMRFDQFTIEQIAGDLLPGATIEQRIATGFHRCTTVNVEAGTDEEENRTNQVIDRVNVTGTVWLGTTLECCQCHNHKYDPFTQRDYYRLLAYFNNSPKETRQQKAGSAALDFVGPQVELPGQDDQRQRRDEITARRGALLAQIEQCVQDDATGLAAWEAEMAGADKAERARLPANIRRILALQPDKRNKNQLAQLRKYFLSQHADAKKLQSELDELDKELAGLAAPASLVMEELPEPRQSVILKRGSFLDPGEPVGPGTPRILTAASVTLPGNRLGLAQWLVDPANPLTARVQANRAWAQFFGRGIVASQEDFGTQAEPATHPELLDWLAVELRDRGWSLKRIHRRIAASATYQQSGKLRGEMLAKDPHNLLLARGPRLRLAAEQIRDNALAVAGLLATKMHGPPVYPPQPEGIWRVTGQVDNTYRTSQGQDAVRRGIYTVQRRSAPYPSFSSFDAPDRSACAINRPRSNTPLQALVLENDPVYVAAARALADRLVIAPQAEPKRAHAANERRTVLAFRTVLSRQPRPAELTELLAIYAQAIDRYATDPAALHAIMEGHPLPPGADAVQWAACFNIAHILLNLDEAITKN